MFFTKNLVRMHDVDMVGILYFPRQFRFLHEALEDFLESEGYGFERVMREENFIFVVVHCESDYLAALKLGDKLEIHVFVEHIGKTSFTIDFVMYKNDGSKVGTGKTVHVCLDSTTRKKIPIPDRLLTILKKNIEN